MEVEKREYLALIQEPIGRMSTASSVFKGFTATIVTGVAALSYTKINTLVLIISFLPISAFAALDIYYLRIERLYRGLYNDVLKNLHPIDFSMDIPHEKVFIKRANATVWNCIKSPSILLFYPIMLLIICGVSLLSLGGII